MLRTRFHSSRRRGVTLLLAGFLSGLGGLGVAADLKTGLAQLRPLRTDGQPGFVEVKPFICSAHGGLTRYSELLKERVEVVLAQSSHFEVATTTRLKELDDERRFQRSRIVGSPRSGNAGTLPEVQAVLAGSYSVDGNLIRADLNLEPVSGTGSQRLQFEFPVEAGLEGVAADLARVELHQSTSVGKKRIHVLANSFSKLAIEEYPEIVSELKSRGFGFAVWKTVEEVLGEDPRFELFMDPRSFDDVGFLRDFLVEATAVNPGAKADCALVLTSHFVRPEKVSRDEMLRGWRLTREAEQYPIEVRLEFYDFSQGDWAARGLRSRAALVGDDPLLGAREAAGRATRDFLEVYRRPNVSPKKIARVASVTNSTGNAEYDPLKFYTQYKAAQVLEATGRYTVVNDGFLYEASTVLPNLQRTLFDAFFTIDISRIRVRTGGFSAGFVSRKSKTYTVSLEMQMSPAGGGRGKRAKGSGKASKVAKSFIATINEETFRKSRGVWILDESDLGQAVASALGQASSRL